MRSCEPKNRLCLMLCLSLAVGAAAACSDDDEDPSAESETEHDHSDHESDDDEDPDGDDDTSEAGALADEDESDVDAHAGHQPTGGKAVTITFAAMVGDDEAKCGQVYRVGTPASMVELADMRLHVHNVRLINAEGDEVAVALDGDRPFQGDGVVLLDFEDGSGACEEGNSELNSEIAGTVPEGDYVGLKFTVGVSFEQNHQSVDAAPPPLNIPAMFWNWLGGYKFMKFDVVPAAAELGAEMGAGMAEAPPSEIMEVAPRWNFHLGSTGCPPKAFNGMMPVLTDPPSGPCDNPNRPEIMLSAFDADSDTVVIDIAALLDGADLRVNAGGPPGCMSLGADAEDCMAVFPHLGLSFESGDCDNDCADQTVFSRK